MSVNPAYPHLEALRVRQTILVRDAPYPLQGVMLTRVVFMFLMSCHGQVLDQYEAIDHVSLQRIVMGTVLGRCTIVCSSCWPCGPCVTVLRQKGL